MPSLHSPALMLPIVESTCSSPSDCVRAPDGTVSAINATASPKTPPTPTPVRKRHAAKSNIVRLKKLIPVNTEYVRMQIASIFARPYLSPSEPKNMPPMPQPIRNQAVTSFPAFLTSSDVADKCMSELSAGTRASVNRR